MSEVKVNKISPRTNCGTTQLGDAGDTITVTGDLKSNSLKSASGSTITLGQSGDTIQLGCGATQTGFGRTGTVDWDTTAKTAGFTAVSGTGYFVNTTSGAITVTLPAGSAGDIVGISDYASTFQTNNVTITPNGTDKINGVNDNATLSTQGLAVSLVYVDATRGWKSVTGSDNDTTGVLPAFVTATGGTVTCCGDYKIHTFTGPGTFTITCAGNAAGSNSVDYLVVAGGGGGGGGENVGSVSGVSGGGAGAGGYRESSGAASGCYSVSPLGACVSALPVTVQGYPITVGGGGSGGPGPGGNGGNGSPSSALSITSTGGGGGSGGNSGAGNGGSGGGVGGACSPGTAGSGNTPPVSPPQGQPGATNPNNSAPYGASGGGGATDVGTQGSGGSAGPGGAGATSSINLSSIGRAGGGGGGAGYNGGVSLDQGFGGGYGGYTPQSNGIANRGGGGSGSNSDAGTGGAGGSGIVIIRYKYQ